MYRQMLMIGLPTETNDVFSKAFALDHMPVEVCQDIEEARSLLRKNQYRLILYNAENLDVDEAQEMASRIRHVTYAPLIMLTIDEAAAATQEAGADLCVPADMEHHRLFSTVMGQIRRNECFSQYDDFRPGAIVLYRGDLMIDSTRHQVTQDGEEIHLLQQEFRLLAFMARNEGIVLTPEQISPAIWLDDDHGAKDAARIVANVRRKLKDSREEPRYIETVHGIGYRFLPVE